MTRSIISEVQAIVADCKQATNPGRRLKEHESRLLREKNWHPLDAAKIVVAALLAIEAIRDKPNPGDAALSINQQPRDPAGCPES